MKKSQIISNENLKNAVKYGLEFDMNAHDLYFANKMSRQTIEMIEGIIEKLVAEGVEREFTEYPFNIFQKSI